MPARSKDRPKKARRGEIQWPLGPATTLGGLFETPILDILDEQSYDFARSDFILAYIERCDPEEPFPEEVSLSDFARAAWAWRRKDDKNVTGLLCEIKSGNPRLVWLESTAQVFFTRINACDETIYAIPRDRVTMLVNARWARRKMYLKEGALMYNPLLCPYAVLNNELPILFGQLFSNPTRYAPSNTTITSPLLDSPHIWSKCTKVRLGRLFEFVHPTHAASFKGFEKLYDTLIPPGTSADQRELEVHRSPAQPLGGDFVVKVEGMELVIQHKISPDVRRAWFEPPSYHDFLFWHRHTDVAPVEEEQPTAGGRSRRPLKRSKRISARESRPNPVSRMRSLTIGDDAMDSKFRNEDDVGADEESSSESYHDADEQLDTDDNDSSSESLYERDQQVNIDDDDRELRGELVVLYMAEGSWRTFQYDRDLARKLKEHLSSAATLAHARMGHALGNLLNEEEPSVNGRGNDPEDLERLRQDRTTLQEYHTFWKNANHLAMHFYEYANAGVGEVACIYLRWDHNHPLGDMFVVRHRWTSEERLAFKATGRLPASLDLVRLARERRRGVILRFGCRNYRYHDARSQHIPLQQVPAELPLTSHKFFLLGASNKNVEFHLPGNLLLLPSEFIKFPEMAHDEWEKSAGNREAAVNPLYTQCLLVGHTQPTDKFVKDQMLKNANMANLWFSPAEVLSNILRALTQETGEAVFTHPEVRDQSSLDPFELDEYIIDAHTLVRAALDYGIARDGDHIDCRNTGYYGSISKSKSAAAGEGD
ncbi:hypothetical protein SLS60_007548 [Paraconiothyrium brasiliense]|uniref:Uncharacterized protein n=1 Tax=Paraconiothyrium brasiliense TaxID=300254 RepID=A0ABR3R6J6_9PLEO